MAECGKWVGKGTVNFPCPLDPHHDGPCIARELPATLREREKWERAQQAAMKGPAPVAEVFDEVEPVEPAEALKVLANMEEVEQNLAPTKQRPGDQPLPVINDLPYVQDAVVADIEERKKIGIERYGTPLQAFNGRDALLDAYQEALDLAMYLKQMLIERDAKAVSQG